MIPTPALGSEEIPLVLARRAALAGLLFGVAGAAAAQEPLIRRGTPHLTQGPFHPLHRPEEDADLTRVGGRGQARGTIIDLAGRITDETGRPVPHARIDTWQTNGLGAYHHPSDGSGRPKDPNFQGGAVFRADAQGAYRMRTVLPQPYATRQRHIHFDIRGADRRLMTQMFFPGEPNDRDGLFRSLGSEALQGAVTAALSGSTRTPGVPLYNWNIALAGE